MKELNRNSQFLQFCEIYPPLDLSVGKHNLKRDSVPSEKMVLSVDDGDGGDTAPLALASLRKATKELKEAADIFENNFQDEPATGRKLGTTLSLLCWCFNLVFSWFFHLLTRRTF